MFKCFAVSPKPVTDRLSLCSKAMVEQKPLVFLFVGVCRPKYDARGYYTGYTPTLDPHPIPRISCAFARPKSVSLSLLF